MLAGRHIVQLRTPLFETLLPPYFVQSHRLMLGYGGVDVRYFPGLLSIVVAISTLCCVDGLASVLGTRAREQLAASGHIPMPAEGVRSHSQAGINQSCRRIS